MRNEGSYSYSPLLFQSFFAKQTEFGKAVKPGKIYPNAFFSNLASIYYFHTYLSGVLTAGYHGGRGKQFSTVEKKKFKVHCDAEGLYQLTNNNKEYIKTGLYRYVVSPKGSLYILTEENNNYFHNTLRASQPVQCAGKVMIRKGKIIIIGNESGHYRPNEEQLLRTIGGLYAAGFLKLDVQVKAFVIDGFFSFTTRSLGTIKELIKQDEIKIPNPWKATSEFSNKMN